jgi:SH3 domain protein
MPRSVLILIITMCLGFLCQESWASKAYVTDTFRISLRRGPSIENKILKFLPSGQPVEVFETEEGWSRIRPIEPDQSGLEGWVLSRYLINRLPWKDQVISLTEENSLIKSNLSEVEEKYKEILEKAQVLDSEVQKYSKALEKSQADYLHLKTESSTYLELKTANENLQAQAEELEDENLELKRSQRNRFLAIGALILLCGLMIGALFGRQEKKRKGYY